MLKQIEKDRVSVIIPTLNEGKNIRDILLKLKKIGLNNFIVIDGHSEDETIKNAKDLGAKVIIQNGRGKGSALRQAFADACVDGEIVVMIDADGSMNPDEIGNFVRAINSGADVVKGSRFLFSGNSEDFTPLRRVGNQIITGVLNFMFQTQYSDSCYGFMAFKREALQKLTPNLTSSEFEIETEICIRSKLQGLKVHEIPSIEKRRVNGVSNLNTFQDGIKIFSLMLNLAMKQT